MVNQQSQEKEFTWNDIWRSAGSSTLPLHVLRISRLLKSAGPRRKRSLAFLVFSGRLSIFLDFVLNLIPALGI